MSINRLTLVIACFLIILSSTLLRAQATSAGGDPRSDLHTILARADSALRNLDRAIYFETTNHERPAVSERPKLLDTGTEAPDWTLNDLEGRQVKLSDLRGKVVLADFWYMACSPCVAAMPGFQKLHERFAKRGVVVIGIDVLGSDDPTAFIKRLGYTYRVLVKGSSAAKDYHVTAFPTLYLIGVDGTIIHADRGYTEGFEDGLGEIIDRHLKEHGM